MGEDEFYDAVENALEKLEEEQEYKDKLKLMNNATMMGRTDETISEATSHQLWPTIDKVNSLLHSRSWLLIVEKLFCCCGWRHKKGGQHSTEVAYLYPDPAAPALIPSIPGILFSEKMMMLRGLINGIEEIGQWP